MRPRAAIRAAQRRLATAARRERAAREVIEREEALIAILTSRMKTHPSHVLTRDAEPLAWWVRPYAFCRSCGVRAGSIASERPCQGDRRYCHTAVPQGSSPMAFEWYNRPGWFCGRPGRYDDAFTIWTCEAGHESTREGPCRDECLPGCPRPGLTTVTE